MSRTSWNPHPPHQDQDALHDDRRDHLHIVVLLLVVLVPLMLPPEALPQVVIPHLPGLAATSATPAASAASAGRGAQGATEEGRHAEGDLDLSKTYAPKEISNEIPPPTDKSDLADLLGMSGSTAFPAASRRRPGGVVGGVVGAPARRGWRRPNVAPPPPRAEERAGPRRRAGPDFAAGHRVNPQYPALAKAARVQGVVVLQSSWMRPAGFPTSR